MAAIGETAVMIGHDLRNPLQAIVNTTYHAGGRHAEALYVLTMITMSK